MSTANDRFYWDIFFIHAVLPETRWERKLLKIYYIFRFVKDVWPGIQNRGITYNKLTYNLRDYGDFVSFQVFSKCRLRVSDVDSIKNVIYRFLKICWKKKMFHNLLYLGVSCLEMKAPSVALEPHAVLSLSAVNGNFWCCSGLHRSIYSNIY